MDLFRNLQKLNFGLKTIILIIFTELIEEEEAFEIFREQQFATIARRPRDGEQSSSRGFRNNLSRLVR